MSPALLAFLVPLLEKILSLAAGPAETWVLEHLISLVKSHLGSLKLNSEWGFSSSITDEKAGIVCCNFTRGGKEAAAIVLYPLTMTAAHQESIAALFGALVDGAEEQLLAHFKKLAPAT